LENGSLVRVKMHAHHARGSHGALDAAAEGFPGSDTGCRRAAEECCAPTAQTRRGSASPFQPPGFRASPHSCSASLAPAMPLRRSAGLPRPRRQPSRRRASAAGFQRCWPGAAPHRVRGRRGRGWWRGRGRVRRASEVSRGTPSGQSRSLCAPCCSGRPAPGRAPFCAAGSTRGQQLGETAPGCPLEGRRRAMSPQAPSKRPSRHSD